MSDKYLYSASRVKAMEGAGYLISQTQLDILLGSKDISELLESLEQTFLGAHLEGGSKKEFNSALEASLSEAKNILRSIAPDPEELDILWYKYDFANLKIILKGLYKNFTDEDILSQCYAASGHEPQRLLEAVKKEKMEFMPQEALRAVGALKDPSGVHIIDMSVDAEYLKFLERFAEAHPYPFVKKYASIYIEFLNIKNQLRASALEGYTEIPRSLLQGGDAGAGKALEALKRIGDERFWEDAIAEYENHGHFTLLERKMDDYMLEFLKRESFAELFSLATLFAFFEARRNDINVIRSLHVFKTTGRSADYIKKYLRNNFLYAG